MTKLSLASATTEPAIGYVVDQLGHLKADLSSLSTQADDCKAVLIDRASKGGNRSFEGREFNATVSFNDRSNTDWALVQQHLLSMGVKQSTIDRAIEKSTKVAEGVPCVRVTARKAAA